MPRSKYIRYTDTHLNVSWPWSKGKLVRAINREQPAGLFLTGDISSGPKVDDDLVYLASNLNCPIYFVLGNHDYYHSSITGTNQRMKALCSHHPNLHWMTEAGVIKLNKRVGLIGTEGWYDGGIGNPDYLLLTTDWILIHETRSMPTMSDRIDFFRDCAEKSTLLMKSRLEEALETFKTVYLLTHFPPWKEATRDEGTLLETYWLPYNVNVRMGKMIEDVMAKHKKQKIVVLAGHTHTDSWIHVSHNIECKVSRAKYSGTPGNDEIIFI